MTGRLFLVLIAGLVIAPTFACDPKAGNATTQAASGQAEESDPVLQGLDAAKRAYIQGRKTADVYVDKAKVATTQALETAAHATERALQTAKVATTQALDTAKSASKEALQTAKQATTQALERNRP